MLTEKVLPRRVTLALPSTSRLCLGMPSLLGIRFGDVLGDRVLCKLALLVLGKAETDETDATDGNFVDTNESDDDVLVANLNSAQSGMGDRGCGSHERERGA